MWFLALIFIVLDDLSEIWYRRILWYHLASKSFVKISTVDVILYFGVYMAVYQYFLSNMGNIWYRRSQQNYIKWFWVFVKAHWKPYLTCGCIWLPVRTFAHLLPHWLKFGMWGLNVMLLSMCDYHENWHRHTWHYFCSCTLTPFYVKKIQVALVKYMWYVMKYIVSSLV